MKVCYVLSTVNINGGANRSLIDLLNYINGKIEPVVILNSHGTIEKYLIENRIKYYIIRFENCVDSSFIKTNLKILINIIAKNRIKKVLRKEKVDILHNNSIITTIGMDAARSMYIPYICHVRENFRDGLGLKLYRFEHVKSLIRDSKNVIFISDYIRRSYQFLGNLNYMIISDGIDSSLYYEKKEIMVNSIINMAIFGVINYQKGQLDAVKSVKALVDRGYLNVHLDIIGKDGIWNGTLDYAESVHTFVKNQGLENYVSFLPLIDDAKKLKECRRKYDINLICSKAEGLGRVTVESMLSGALTIAARAGATTEIISNGVNGFLYNAENGVELADIIESSIVKKQISAKIALCGQKYALEKFDIHTYSASIWNLYKLD